MLVTWPWGPFEGSDRAAAGAVPVPSAYSGGLLIGVLLCPFVSMLAGRIPLP